MYDGFGIAPYTFFNLLMCAALFYGDLRQFRFCRLLCRGSSSPEDLQYSGYYQKVDRNRYVLFTGTFKRITNTGSMMRFQFTKVTTASPHITKVHHTFLAALKWKLLNPRQPPGRSGPNYYLYSPRRVFKLCCSSLFSARISYHTWRRVSTYSNN